MVYASRSLLPPPWQREELHVIAPMNFGPPGCSRVCTVRAAAGFGSPAAVADGPGERMTVAGTAGVGAASGGGVAAVPWAGCHLRPGREQNEDQARDETRGKNHFHIVLFN